MSASADSPRSSVRRTRSTRRAKPANAHPAARSIAVTATVRAGVSPPTQAKRRARERSPAWGLWTFGDLATLLVAVRGPELGVAELAYVLVELLCHG